MSELFVKINLANHGAFTQIPMLIFLGLTRDNLVSSLTLQLNMRTPGSQARIVVTHTKKQHHATTDIMTDPSGSGVTVIDRAQAQSIGCWMSDVISGEKTFEAEVAFPKGTSVKDVHVIVIREKTEGTAFSNDMLTISCNGPTAGNETSESNSLTVEPKKKPRRYNRY